MRFVGIDPGYRGAWVVLDDSGRTVSGGAMPVLGSPSRPKGYDAAQIGEVARRVVAEAGSGGLRVVCEAPAHVRVKGGLHAHATACLFLCAGLWQGAFGALGVEVAFVAATTWQKALLTGVPGADTKARAKWLAGGGGRVEVSEGWADAWCVARWSTRGTRGTR